MNNLHNNLPGKLLLKTLVFLSLLLGAQTDSSDKNIQAHYQTIQQFKPLLELTGKIKLPQQTFLEFIGDYPSRTGMIIYIYRTVYDEIYPEKIISSVSKKMTIRFNGPVLSFISIDVKSSSVSNPAGTQSVFTDETPMDNDLGNLLLEKDDLSISMKDIMSDEANSKYAQQIKKEIYAKLLEDFIIAMNIIQSANKKSPAQEVIKTFKNAGF